MLTECLVGTLPWKGKSKETIGKLKLELTNESLFKGSARPLLKMYQHLKTLEYADKPNYNLLVTIFDEMLEEQLSESSRLLLEETASVMSLDKATHTPEEDTCPGLMTSPHFSKLKNKNKMPIIERRESATLFEEEVALQPSSPMVTSRQSCRLFASPMMPK
jgi:hypothetical protein